MKPTILIAALLSLGIAGSSLPVTAAAQTAGANSIADAQRQRADYIRSHYSKFEYQIPMRDGKKLFTTVYVPLDAGPAKTYPVLMVRTPYSVAPYGAANYKTALAPTADYEKDGYIFVFQDVRGTYMSEGEFVNMRPHISQKKSAQDVDESSDTYDTIEWLLRHQPYNNGKFGQWGISYPGFYTSAGAIDSHPALKAVSPQAPIADWFRGDDMHRHGALNLAMAFGFFHSFGQPRPQPSDQRSVKEPEFGTPDGYQFFLQLGSLKNVNEKFFKERIAFWNDIIAHPDYDSFWQSRNLLPHLKNIKAAVLTVGGWYDTEDLYGPLQTFAAIEKQNMIDDSLSRVSRSELNSVEDYYDRVYNHTIPFYLSGLNYDKESSIVEYKNSTLIPREKSILKELYFDHDLRFNESLDCDYLIIKIEENEDWGWLSYRLINPPKKQIHIQCNVSLLHLINNTIIAHGYISHWFVYGDAFITVNL